MTNILILCTGNSCRSQIAHGFFKAKLKGDYNIFSAGIETHGVNPGAIATMKEVGIDLSSHTSNNVEEYSDVEFDHIITVCDHAYENCPYIVSNAKRHHQNFPDPAKGHVEFEEARNLIENYVNEFIKNQL